MISIVPFRRLDLEHEGCAPRHRGIAFACYKGNASQTQTSQQTGVQGSGTASSGTGNAPVSNTGTQVNAGATVNGNSNDTSKNYNLTNGSSVSITDDGAVNDALSSLNSALTGAQQLVGDAGQSLVDSNTQALQLAAQSAENQAQSQQNSLSSWLQSIPTWQIVAFVVAVLGILVGLPLFISRKSK